MWPEGKDKILRFERDDEDEQEESDDSLFDILTGRTPIPEFNGNSREENGMEEDGFGDSVGTVQGLDDTFRGKRGRDDTHDEREGGREEREEQSLYDEGVLGESGMSEMF